MALTIGDNFSYLGAKPLDGRIKYNTISAMVAMTADTLYDGIMAYCVEDGKEYQWKSTNDVDQTLGKWREFASGGGASALDDLTDVDITSATDGQVLEYNNTSGKWVNANKPSIPSAYTSTPEMDGVGAAGSSTAFAKGDHVHPSDTTKADVSTVNGILDGTALDSFGDVETALADKADKVASATSGDFAGLDANGNLTDSGKAPSDLTGITTIAPAFDATATYNIGDRCTYNGAFYKFTAAHTGAWDAQDVTETTVNEAILSNTIGIGGGFAPIGTIISYMGTTAPQDYLACDGTAYNIADYPQLASFIESQFGSKNYFGGNGTTTFAVPDLRGEFLRGTGTNSHANQGSGAAVGVHQDATELPRIGISNTTLLFKSNTAYTNVHEQAAADSYFNSNSSGTIKNSTTTMTDGSTVTPTDMFTTRPTNTSILWCIKAIVAGEVYSTDERVVGTWIDGKPIYQKTVDCGALPNNTTKLVEHGISDIDAIISMSGFAFNSNHNGFPLPCPENNSNYTVNIDKDGNHIRITTAANRSSLTSSYITIKYTKTT